MIERDFSKVQFKVNCSGSWANLVLANVEHCEAVKAACETIAAAGGGRACVRFKVLDAEGGVIEEFGPVPPNGKAEWHEPRRR